MAKEPKLSVKPATVLKKLNKAIESIEDLSYYLKAKKHDQGILNFRDLFSMFNKLYDAREEYEKK